MNTFVSFVRRGASHLLLASVLFSLALSPGCQQSATQEQADPVKRQQSLDKQRQLHQMERKMVKDVRRRAGAH